MIFEQSTSLRAPAGATSPEQRVVELDVQGTNGAGRSCGHDLLAVEQPLEICLVHGAARDRTRRSLSVTLRTSGCAVELTVGCLFVEGLVHRPENIERAENCGPATRPLGIRELVRVELAREAIGAQRIQR
jgi:formate dehydrogenase assembly factor FdhD